jgi:hypothetical protein
VKLSCGMTIAGRQPPQSPGSPIIDERGNYAERAAIRLPVETGAVERGNAKLLSRGGLPVARR